MKPDRTLSLRREALAELPPAELRRVAGGGLTNDISCNSCYDYISCNLGDCLFGEPSDVCA